MCKFGLDPGLYSNAIQEEEGAFITAAASMLGERETAKTLRMRPCSTYSILRRKFIVQSGVDLALLSLLKTY